MSEMSQTPHSPPWNTTVKVVVIVFGVVLVVATLLRFQEIIPSTIIAVLIAYVITPVVDFVNERTRISRGLVTAAIYLVFFAVVALAISMLAPLLVRQALSVKLDLERIGFRSSPRSRHHRQGQGRYQSLRSPGAGQERPRRWTQYVRDPA